MVSRNNPGTKRWPKHSTSKRNNSFTQIQLNINRLALSLLTVFLASAVPASADLTAFIGVNTTPSNRQVRGFGAGLSLLMLGLEFEYSDTALKDTSGQRLQTGMANLLAQTPFVIKSRLQFYGTIGAGLYREKVGILQVTNRATNAGGGVKIALTGPVRVRIDYRTFRLLGTTTHRQQHRLYSGLNLGF